MGIDAEVGALAGTQGGYVTHAQLLALGMSRTGINRRVQSGRLIPVYRGVYAVGHRPTNPLDRAHGALLAVGERAALSHDTAASLWGIWPQWRFPLHVSSPLDRRPRGLRVHHRPALLQSDITTHHGLRVTTPALTYLDLAPRLTEKRRIRAMNELRMGRLVTPDDLYALIERFPRHPGRRHVIPILGTAPAEPDRSDFEDEWHPFARHWNMPPYETNGVVGGYRVDVLFIPDLLIVQLDGWQTHGTKTAFETDRAQDAEILAETGIPTLRITRDQFRSDPARLARRIHATLDRRRRAA